MNHRALLRKAGRWVLLLYLAVVAVTGVAHTCPSSAASDCDPHHAAIAAVVAADSQDCPTCDLHRATISALVSTNAVVAILPRESSSFGESAVSSPASRALSQLSRGPPAA